MGKIQIRLRNIEIPRLKFKKNERSPLFYICIRPLLTSLNGLFSRPAGAKFSLVQDQAQVQSMPRTHCVFEGFLPPHNAWVPSATRGSVQLPLCIHFGNRLDKFGYCNAGPEREIAYRVRTYRWFGLNSLWFRLSGLVAYSEDVTRWIAISRVLFQIREKKYQAPKSGLSCLDRSENLINRKSRQFYIETNIYDKLFFSTPKNIFWGIFFK